MFWFLLRFTSKITYDFFLQLLIIVVRWVSF
jgi:hypothetical protein